jgi:MoaA/NifB/PqqE/SkfB family radical SAM enzyme
MSNNRFNLVGVCSTTRCNGKCKFCGRTHLKRQGKDIEIVDLDLNILHSFLNRTDHLSLNGIFGDAMLHPQLLPFIESTQQYEYLTVEISTNGSAHDDSFWSELGKAKNTKILFGIDGLEDTHYRYRHTDFNKAFNNMKTYIKNGGKAIWQFIAFSYNAHQIKEASDIAKKIGCDFIVIRSNHYDDEFSRPSKDVFSRNEIWEMTENSGRYCYWKYRNGKPFRSVFIDAYGYAHPCCHTAVFPNSPYNYFHHYDELRLLYLASKDKLSIYENDIDGVYETPYFKVLAKTFEHAKVCRSRCYGKVMNVNEKFEDDRMKII